MPRINTKVKESKETKKVSVAKMDTKTKIVSKTASKKASGLTVDVYGVKGTVVETIALPQEMFGAKANPTLMAQAIRVYLANQRRGTVSTKTRGEVDGSTRKIYRQKGTGRARHGGARAPIFVHGGLAFGPKPRDYSLKLPQKMKQKALFSSLSSKLQDGKVTVVSGFETVSPKTKEMVGILKNFSKESGKKKKILIVTPAISQQAVQNVHRAARNIEGVRLLEANKLNTYDVLNTSRLVLMKDSITLMQQTFGRKEKHI